MVRSESEGDGDEIDYFGMEKKTINVKYHTVFFSLPTLRKSIGVVKVVEL